QGSSGSPPHRLQNARHGRRCARRPVASTRTGSEGPVSHRLRGPVVQRTRRDSLARRSLPRKAVHRLGFTRSGHDDPVGVLRRISGPCIILISSLAGRVLMEPLDRNQRVLAALVRAYIASGEPVASSLLVSAAGLGVSSATVRNILSQLEEEGYVQQPHTSAGRIPTDRGYRFFVDLLLKARRSNRATAAVEARLRRDSPDRLIDSVLPQVTHVLSQASRTVGFAVRTTHDGAVFDRVEFIPLAATRVLVVIVARGGHVIQKVIDVDEALTADDLRQSANYLNAEFSGLPLSRARQAVLDRL